MFPGYFFDFERCLVFRTGGTCAQRVHLIVWVRRLGVFELVGIDATGSNAGSNSADVANATFGDGHDPGME